MTPAYPDNSCRSALTKPASRLGETDGTTICIRGDRHEIARSGSTEKIQSVENFGHGRSEITTSIDGPGTLAGARNTSYSSLTGLVGVAERLPAGLGGAPAKSAVPPIPCAHKVASPPHPVATAMANLVAAARAVSQGIPAAKPSTIRGAHHWAFATRRRRHFGGRAGAPRRALSNRVARGARDCG